MLKMTPKQNRTIHRVISVFGEKNQQMQAIEELMELQRAVFENVHRGTDNRDNIVEEVADVEIMLEQLKLIFTLHGKVTTKKGEKIERLKGIIEKYKEKQACKNPEN